MCTYVYKNYYLQLGIKKLNMNFYCQLLLVGNESDGVGGCHMINVDVNISLFGINTLVVECILIHCDCLSSASTMFVSVSLHGGCDLVCREYEIIIICTGVT